MTDHLTMPLADLLGSYEDGDQIGWAVEFRERRQAAPHRIAELTVSIADEGIRDPILLGSDGRVWDGHHRLAVAHALRLPTVPVEHASTTRPDREDHQ